ncbi:MAG: class I SAM-dependent methyltransferase [Asgard group archaeon]|nr:class I SAM-dependent methyltransferase [Asgard group archaeon]
MCEGYIIALNNELLKKFLEKRNDEGWYEKYSNTITGNFYNEIVKNYIDRYLPPEDSHILDIGADPGIFSENIAKKNRRLTICDISEEQLKSTRERFNSLKISDRIEQFTLLDSYHNLIQFADETFDMVICFYDILSYSCDKRHKLLNELSRILKKGAPILFTVKNKLWYLKKIIQEEQLDKLLEPSKTGIWEFLDTNYKQHDEYPDEPVFYAYDNLELEMLLEKNQFEILEIFAINLLLQNNNSKLIKIKNSPEAWTTLLEIEEKIAKTKALQNAGERIFVIGRKAII